MTGAHRPSHKAIIFVPPDADDIASVVIYDNQDEQWPRAIAQYPWDNQNADVSAEDVIRRNGWRIIGDIIIVGGSMYEYLLVENNGQPMPVETQSETNAGMTETPATGPQPGWFTPTRT